MKEQAIEIYEFIKFNETKHGWTMESAVKFIMESFELRLPKQDGDWQNYRLDLSEKGHFFEFAIDTVKKTIEYAKWDAWQHGLWHDAEDLFYGR